MKSLREKLNTGSITLGTVTGWGLAIITTVSGIFITQVSATNNRVGKVEVDVAVLQTQYANIDKKLDDLLLIAQGQKKEELLVKGK